MEQMNSIAVKLSLVTVFSFAIPMWTVSCKPETTQDDNEKDSQQVADETDSQVKECEKDEDCDGDEVCDDKKCVDEEPDVLVIGDADDGGGTLTVGNGTTLTFDTGSLSEGTTVSATKVNVDTVQSGGQTFDVVTGIEVEMDGDPETPPVITVPNDDNLAEDSQILIVEVVELEDGNTGINLVGTASVSEDGETIVSNNESDDEMFPGDYGVDSSGTYILIVTDGNQEFTVGQVLDSDGNPAASADVFSSSGVFVGVTDADGYFAIPELIGSTTLYVTDPLTGGYGNIYVAVSDSVQIVEIDLTEPEVTADGLPNGCLDVGDLDSYHVRGNTSVVSALDPILPLQGVGMVLMTSGEGAEENQTSGLDITFTVPSGVSRLIFDYRFLSDEYPDYVGTQYNDLFNVIAYTESGAVLIIEERVNDAEMIASETVYGGETSWKEVNLNVSDFAGRDSPLTLSFVVSDVADAVYDTAVLVDNLRFDTGDCDNEQTVTTEDTDDDSYTSDEDCNDNNADIHPGAEEVCGDGADNNCDGTTDEGCSVIVDVDGDTYPPEEDCDDNNAAIYPGAPEACDEADNDCDGTTDEDCVAELPQSHHVDLSEVNGFVSTSMYAIYQNFSTEYLMDLSGLTLTFVPDANVTSYTVTASSLSWDSNEGDLTTGTAGNCDDCADLQALPFAFPFYGTTYQEMYIGSNGYITFAQSDATYTESVEHFLSHAPRISAMFDDLDTRGDATVGDDIYFYSDSAKAVLTCRNIQHYNVTGTSNTFQFVLYANGTIHISFDGIEDVSTGAVTGISPGSISTTVSAK